MSLARAFTKRVRRVTNEESTSGMPSSPLPTRANTTRRAGPPINRKLISSPVELISTTNMLSYNAPDISSLRHASSSSSASVSSKSSAKDSEASDISSPDSLTDASSIESPSPTSPAPNHLSGFFPAPSAFKQPPTPVEPVPRMPRKFASTISLKEKASTPPETMPTTPALPVSPTTPAIPSRALSHSKRAHEQIARQKSINSMASSTRSSRELQLQLRHSREQRASAEIFKTQPEPNHPFGHELEQLNEVAEEFGGAVAEVVDDEDAKFLASRGLLKFSAEEYCGLIEPLFGGLFGERRGPAAAAVQAGWI